MATWTCASMKILEGTYYKKQEVINKPDNIYKQ